MTLSGLPMKSGETGSDTKDFPLAWPPFLLGPSSPVRGLEILEKRTAQLDYLTKPCDLPEQAGAGALTPFTKDECQIWVTGHWLLTC